MEVSIPLELREATQDLHMLRALLPQTESQEVELLADPTSDMDRQPKWPRSHPKGYGRQGGKGNRQGAQPPSTGSWSHESTLQAARDSGKPPRRQRETSDKDLAKQLAEMKSSLGMLTTLVIRQEIQQNVSKQDTSFVLFLDTRGPHNIATSLYKMGETWVNTKRDHPERLHAPLRVILFQHLIEVVLNKFKAMIDSPSSRSTAQNLGLLMGDGINVPALKWDPETRQHVQDPALEPQTITAIKEALEELMVLCTKTLVIARFHGMRKLSEEYAAPTLGMFLEIGMRTPEAQSAWNHLHRLQQSASWKAAGVFLSVPAFTESLQCLNYSYRLSACIIHLGEAPDHGHYHNVFCSARDLNYYIGDDGVSARPISDAELCSLSQDIYLLFYIAHKAD
ncbi:eff [Symbiodinium sp. CCMP2456]|nr:eff [Symbiodinium sp. CCMP2456]